MKQSLAGRGLWSRGCRARLLATLRRDRCHYRYYYYYFKMRCN